ncbi:hypothetical protein EDB83DRAFT_2413344, partial [Lactarius deliciosus]
MIPSSLPSLLRLPPSLIQTIYSPASSPFRTLQHPCSRRLSRTTSLGSTIQSPSQPRSSSSRDVPRAASPASSNTNPDDDEPPALPLSTPLPPCAFARVWPTPDWPRSWRRGTNWGERGSTMSRVLVRFAEVPLRVLPGREHEILSFVGKVIGRGRGRRRGRAGRRG